MLTTEKFREAIDRHFRRSSSAAWNTFFVGVAFCLIWFDALFS